MIPLSHWLLASAGLFVIGLAGVILRRNLIVILMSLELMLNASNLALVAASQHFGRLDGQVFALFVMAVAAAEVAVGLAIVVALFRAKKSVDVSEVTVLKL